MERRSYLVDDADLDNEMDEDEQAVNAVNNIFGSDVRKEIHLYGSNWQYVQPQNYHILQDKNDQNKTKMTKTRSQKQRNNTYYCTLQ